VQNVQIACPALGVFSALFDVRSLDPSGLLIKLSKELGPTDIVTVYGTQDDTASGTSTNLTLIGSLPGNNGNTSNALFAAGWAFLIAFRTQGASPGGNVIASGNQNGTGSTVIPPSIALPAFGAFSTTLSLAVLAGSDFLVGLDANQTSGDTFNVYGTNDVTAGGVAGAAGGQLLGSIAGGDGTAPGTVLSVSGFSYLFFQRTGPRAGGTPGTAIVWGTSVTASGGGGGSGSTPSALNKSMPAQTTTADGQLACATAIGATPKGFVGVNANGVSYDPGNGTKIGVPCYFSGDGGTTARAQGAIVTGDSLYWNGSVAGFQLFGGVGGPPADLIDFVFSA
jgi:hypothetical protein